MVYSFARKITVLITIGCYFTNIWEFLFTPDKWSLLTIAVILNVLLKIFTCVKKTPDSESSESKKKHFNFACTFSIFDIFTIILFCCHFGKDYSIHFLVKSLAESGTEYNLSQYIAWVIPIFLIAVIANEILSRGGSGLTRRLRILYYKLKYVFFYFILSSDNDLSQYLKNKKMLSDKEYELLLSAVQWKKSNKESTYPILFRKDSEKRSFIKDWLYDISLVNGDNITIKKAQAKNASSVSYEVEVDLSDSHLALINNKGKKFLKDYYENICQTENISKLNEDTHNFFRTGINPSEPTKMHLNPNCFYRWGSAGTIPIIKWKGRQWIAFVYRDIYPEGWNLPLGASECELEKGRPAITAIREMLEEIMVIEQSFNEYSNITRQRRIRRREIYHHLLNSIEGETNYEANKRQFYSRQSKIINQTCQLVFDRKRTNDGPVDDTIECENDTTSLNIRVTDTNRIYTRRNSLSTNCLVVVDAYEQGIECIKPVLFEIEKNNELRMGEVDYIEEKWINNPIMLIDYEKLKEYFSISHPYENINNDRFGEGLFLDFLKEPSNYHIFGLNMKERETCIAQLIGKKEELEKHKFNLFQRKEIKEQLKHIKALDKYLRDFVNKNNTFFADSRINNKKNVKQNPAFYLCPASWKALSYYFSDLYETKAYKGAIGE